MENKILANTNMFMEYGSRIKRMQGRQSFWLVQAAHIKKSGNKGIGVQLFRKWYILSYFCAFWFKKRNVMPDFGDKRKGSGSFWRVSGRVFKEKGGVDF